MSEAYISGVRLAAAHEGDAELIITLAHANGGESEVVLDRMATDALMASSQAKNIEGLTGTGWQQVRDALVVSWNRFAIK